MCTIMKLIIVENFDTDPDLLLHRAIQTNEQDEIFTLTTYTREVSQKRNVNPFV